MGMSAPLQPPAMSLDEFHSYLANVQVMANIVPKGWKLIKPRVRVPYNKEPTNG